MAVRSSWLLSLSLAAGLCACGQKAEEPEVEETTSAVADAEEKAYIEETLNLANNADLTWTHSADADAWVMSIVSAVAYPELPDQQGVSVCVPGAYVTGIDTDGDGATDGYINVSCGNRGKQDTATNEDGNTSVQQRQRAITFQK